MHIRRLEASVAEDTSPGDWPELASAELLSKPLQGWIEWRGDVMRETPARLEVAVRGQPTGVPPDYYYMVELPGDEFGALLGGLQPEAVPEVIDAFLRTAGPELLGAVAGRIIAHVAWAASCRRGEAGT